MNSVLAGARGARHVGLIAGCSRGHAASVSDVAGSLGRGKLIVLPPAFSGGNGIEVGIGLSRFWTRQLRAAGRETIWFTMGVPGTSNPRKLQVFDAWPERQIAELLVASLQARYGLAPELTTMGTRAKLSVRLFEVTGGGRIQAIEGWAYEGDNDGVPPFAFEVVEGVSRCLGLAPAAVSWPDAFGTGDELAAMYFLSALGAMGLLEDGFSPSAELAIQALTATYAEASLMQPAIELMPDLLKAMVKVLGASELQLAGVLRSGREALGRNPPEWDGLLERVVSC